MTKMPKPTVGSILALALLCVVSVLVAAESQPPEVAWSQDNPITWDLFQATPPSDAAQRNEAAAIHMTVGWHATFTVSSSDGAHWTGTVASISVTNTMEPTLSWVVPGMQAADLLLHEKLHFDLSEVYRRKIQRSFERMGICHAATQQDAIDQLNTQLCQTADAILDKLYDMTDLYDAQTAHGTDANQQTRWQNLIQAWLVDPMSAP